MVSAKNEHISYERTHSSSDEYTAVMVCKS